MDAGAQRRYHEQQSAYRDTRADLADVAPGLIPQLDDIYRHPK